MKKIYVVIEKFDNYYNDTETISCIGVFKSLKKAKKAIRKIANSNGVYFQEVVKNEDDLNWGICYTYRYLDFARDESIYKVVECSIDEQRIRDVFNRHV